MNGNFLGIGADLALNESVRVDQSQAPGLLITNGEFTSFKNSNFAPLSTSTPRQVYVDKDNTGAVVFDSSSFWGPTDKIANIEGSGTVTFSNCVFVQWDLYNKDGSPAIYSNGGNLILIGNQFDQKGLQVLLTSKVNKATIIGNIVTGPLNMDYKNASHYAATGNVGDDS